MSIHSPYARMEATTGSRLVLEEDLPMSLDEKLSNAGAEAFFRLKGTFLSQNLDKELCGCANAARQLGSSVGILYSVFKLCEVLSLFRENAANLRPRKIAQQPRETFSNPNVMDRQLVLEDTDTLPAQFESFAKGVVAFLKPSWRYVHGLTTEIGDHVDNITGTLSMFIEIGVPTIRFHQQHATSDFLNLSTVGAIFSAVTATTLQFSYNVIGNVLSDSVNAFWFSPLVFSIAAAVNSLLVLFPVMSFQSLQIGL
ncbi:hypothetical protein EV363DRAFT_1191094 [Boletus edulis]|uniref:Uncharacterized protein n=1 Tax=Boletus edulis BED1 TaxID=1328754 RepID=A0AAD4G9A4_BOLED|nr:hypothetical protein EV363DRAFT_1191094 [Boletus edulis]KAF8429396.1 hypothetical protein L210DRAFT_3652146 [Boletus edulis BED1]